MGIVGPSPWRSNHPQQESRILKSQTDSDTAPSTKILAEAQDALEKDMEQLWWMQSHESPKGLEKYNPGATNLGQMKKPETPLEMQIRRELGYQLGCTSGTHRGCQMVGSMGGE